MKVRDITLISFSAALIAVCSWISIPAAVPFTLQTFAVFLSIGLLGGKRGTLTVLVYILLGAVGIPVFSGFNGGIGALLGTTGGYIIAAAMATGLLVCYAFGTAWFMLMYLRTTGNVALLSVLSWCVFPFVIPDIAKICLALFLTKRLKGQIIRL